MGTSVHWSALFKGPAATVAADEPNVVEIEREVIPVIFVPGIMGSRLKRTRTGPDGGARRIVWDPDRRAYQWALARASYTTIRDWMVGERFDPEYLSVIGRTPDGAVDEDDRDGYGEPRGYAGAFDRGWAGIYQDSYVPFLQNLERHAWSEPIRHAFELPVHAFGYNWTQSNLDSGRQLADYARATVEHYKTTLGRTCDHVILVTHSMGGLVTRAAVKELEGTDVVLGVVHGAQPAPGSPLSYWRMKAGMDDFALGLAIGHDGSRTTILLGNMPGGLELLPNKTYRMNPDTPPPNGTSGPGSGSPRWLRYTDPATGATVTRPRTGDPYAEIYRERRQFWRLVDEAWLDPLGRGGAEATAWEYYLTYLRVAESYHDQLDGYTHPETVQFYATDLSTQDGVVFGRRPGRERAFSRWNLWKSGYHRRVNAQGLVTGDEDAPTNSGWIMDLDGLNDTGDGTVSDAAGRHLPLPDGHTEAVTRQREGNPKHRQHQNVYLSGAAQEITQNAIENLCLKRIDDVVGPAD